MTDSSSEGSADEEEIFRNFDQEAKLIVQNETLPKKSSDRYLLNYNSFKTWQMKNKTSLSNSYESNLIVYFTELKKKLSTPSLWSIWSMLHKTLSTKENINIQNFILLKSLLKNNAKGYKPKKAYTLKWEQIMTFMNTAPDHVYLATKVMLVIGICGAMRCCEISNLKVTDVEDLSNKLLISINNTKNDYSGQFVVGELFYSIIKKYIALRPNDYSSDRFFVRYDNGKCMRQEIGRHIVGKAPERIATFLNLENKHRYTGHCFRRTAATLASESGATMQMVKQMGRWRSDAIAQGYIENSLNNRQIIFNHITQDTSQKNPSVNAQLTNEEKTTELDCNFNWSDFSDEFSSDKSIAIPEECNHFITASNKTILSPPINNCMPVSSKTFLTKQPVKIIFNNEPAKPPKVNDKIAKPIVNNKTEIAQSSNNNNKLTHEKPIESSCNKKKKILNELNVNKNYDLNSVSSNQGIKFEQNTFNNCVFNITYKGCDKDD